MPALHKPLQRMLDDLVRQLEGINGISAIVLGGSHARGRAHPQSDLDIGLYYRETSPFAVADVRAVVQSIHDLTSGHVFDFFEWGPWVNGGAWLTIGDQRVDLIYRSLDQVETVLADANQGRYEIHYGQQPPFGFFSPTYLGEVHIAQPLRDPNGEIDRLKDQVAGYPAALRQSIIQKCLWGVEFGLAAFAPKFAYQGDVYGFSGCLTRFAFYLVLVLFALNRVYLLNDKTALTETTEFPRTPDRFAIRIAQLLGNIGDTPDALTRSLQQMQDLFHETAELSGKLYVSQHVP